MVHVLRHCWRGGGGGGGGGEGLPDELIQFNISFIALISFNFFQISGNSGINGISSCTSKLKQQQQIIKQNNAHITSDES